MKLTLFKTGLILRQHPVASYLVQTEDGTNILIDSGYRPGSSGEVPNSPDAMIRAEDEHLILNQLPKLGLRPEDIHIYIATHLDADHAGYIGEFPNAEIVIQKSHLEFARATKLPRITALREHWEKPGLRYREVEGDVELLPGIELVESGGHVLGHQSVLLRLPQTGPVLLAIDAIPSQQMSDPETRPITPIDLDEATVRASTRKLMELAQREGVRLIIFGHDAAQWETLKSSPEFYE